jgi:two-component system nitrate/nitrite sensor histidine kinase NarX
MAIETRRPVALRTTRRPRRSSPEVEVRRFVARELHDRVAQALTAMLVDLELFRAGQVGRQEVIEEIDSLESSLRCVMDSLRDLMNELRGESRLPSEGFNEVVARLLVEFERDTGIEAHLTVGTDWPALVPSGPAVHLCRIIGEALTNVRRHSSASHVAVALESLDESGLSITVSDDGRGFEPELTNYAGLGILGMRERAQLLGARLQLGSHDGAGTIVTVIVPGSAVS